VSDVAALLRQTPLLARRGPWSLASWPVRQASAVAAGLLAGEGDVRLLMIDEREVTGLCRTERLSRLPPPQHCQHGWSLLTLDQPMDWALTGVLAAVSAALARAEIPIGALTAYARDHVLVPHERLEQALAALADVCGPARTVD
jgi:hypothetical protein